MLQGWVNGKIEAKLPCPVLDPAQLCSFNVFSTMEYEVQAAMTEHEIKTLKKSVEGGVKNIQLHIQKKQADVDKKAVAQVKEKEKELIKIEKQQKKAADKVALSGGPSLKADSKSKTIGGAAKPSVFFDLQHASVADMKDFKSPEDLIDIIILAITEITMIAMTKIASLCLLSSPCSMQHRVL